MLRKELGRIKSVHFGFGGYQEAQFGLTVDLGGDGWGVGSFTGMWADRSSGAKWTREDQVKEHMKTLDFVQTLLKQGKVFSVDQLQDLPVEVVFDGNTLHDWRILKEVL